MRGTGTSVPASAASTVCSRAMSCAVGSTWPSGGRRSTHSWVASPIEYVRFERPPEISDACSGASVAPSTLRREPRPQAIEIDTGRSLRHGPETTDRRSRATAPRTSGLRAAGVARLHRPAVAAGVAGDATDGHVDAEAGRGALFFGLAAPEAVLAVLARPGPALDERRARAAHGAGLRLAGGPGLGALAGGGEEQPRLAAAGRLARPTATDR